MTRFSRVKGYLDIEPLEAVGIKPAPASQLYLLFQIDTKVKRSKIIPTKDHITYKWPELTSQCRFNINPDVDANLTVYLMDNSSSPVPKMVGKGKVDLLKLILEDHRPEVRVELNKPIYAGVVVLEITFHLTVPMIPKRQPQPQPQLPDQEQSTDNSSPELPSEGLITKKLTKAQSSSLNDVFVSADYKPEAPTIGKFVNKFKKTMKKPVKAMKQHNRSKSGNWVEEEATCVEVEPKSSRTTPVTPVTPVTPLTPASITIPATVSKSASASHEEIGNSYFSKPEIITDSDEEDEDEEDSSATNSLEKNKLPSPNTGNKELPTVEEYERRVREQILNERKSKETHVKLSPETLALLNRLQSGVFRKDDFKLDRGDSFYNGNGSWERGCLRDSVKVGKPPTLPPKIPIGMTREEYFSTHRMDYINYVKTVTTLTA